jgi:hypothetical protein
MMPTTLRTSRSGTPLRSTAIARPHLFHLTEKAPSTAADIEKSQFALIASGEHFSQLRQGLTSPIEEHLDLSVVPLNRRLDQIIQMQLDEHAARIKKLEAAVFSK